MQKVLYIKPEWKGDKKQSGNFYHFKTLFTNEPVIIGQLEAWMEQRKSKQLGMRKHCTFPKHSASMYIIRDFLSLKKGGSIGTCIGNYGNNDCSQWMQGQIALHTLASQGYVLGSVGIHQQQLKMLKT